MTSDEAAIRDLVATWMSATQSGNTEKVLSLMTDDVVFLVAGRPPMIGKTAFAAASQANSKSGAAPLFKSRSEIQEIQVHGDWAFMWTELSVTMTPSGGEPVQRAGNTLTIFTNRL